MNFLFDIIIIGIIVFSVYMGVSRGFIKSVMRLLSFFIASFLAYTFKGDLAQVYNENFFSASFTEKVSNTISPVVQKTGEAFDIKKLFADMPEVFKDLLNRFGANVGELESKFSSSSASAETVENMSRTIAEPISRMLSNALAFVTIFVGALIILAILTFILDQIFKLPVLKKANKILGFVFGLIIALVYAFIFSKVAVMIINVGIAIRPDIFNSNIIENSFLLKFFSGFSFFGIA